jgi:hypothetical protein
MLPAGVVDSNRVGQHAFFNNHIGALVEISTASSRDACGPPTDDDDVVEGVRIGLCRRQAPGNSMGREWSNHDELPLSRA